MCDVTNMLVRFTPFQGPEATPNYRHLASGRYTFRGPPILLEVPQVDDNVKDVWNILEKGVAEACLSPSTVVGASCTVV